MSCRSTKGRYLANKSRCIITLITEYLTWLVKTKAWGNFKKKIIKKQQPRKWKKTPGSCRALQGMERGFEPCDERGTGTRGWKGSKKRERQREEGRNETRWVCARK